MTEMMLIVVVSVFFSMPFLKFPPDDHFANYTSWAFFRKNGEPLPAYFLLLNQGGFCRMFLYYFAAVMLKMTGKKYLLTGLRGVTICLNTCIAVLIFFITIKLADAESLFALVGSIIFLFISTRPQFELLKYNPEIYHVAGSIVGVVLIFYLSPINSMTIWWLLPVFTWIVFVGINCKILFCLDSAAMALAVFITSGFNYLVLVLYVLSVINAFIIFKLIYRNVSIKNLFSLNQYLNFFNNQNILLNFSYNYKTFYHKTPLIPFFILYVIGLSASYNHDKFIFMLLWSVSTIAIVIQQKRFCTYFFHICFAPMVVPIATGLTGLYSTYSWVSFLIVGVFIVLSWKSIVDFRKYYLNKPLKHHIKKVYDSFYCYTSYDFRVDDIVCHYNFHRKPFIVWQTDLLSHYMTKQEPICLIGSMVFHAHVMYPERQKILIHAALRKKPKWVYDFSGAHWGDFQFNPIAFYLSSGIVFIPEMKKNNILYYRFDKENEPPLGRVVDNMRLYVINSILLDTFQDEVKNICGSEYMLPQELNIDLSDLCMNLVNGSTIKMKLESEDLLEENFMDRPGIGMLYLCAFALFQGNRTKAEKRLENWKGRSGFLMQMYPPLSFSVLVISSMCGKSSEQFKWPQKNIFEISFVKDMLAVSRLSEKLINSNILSEADKIKLIRCFHGKHLEDTEYQSHYIQALKESMKMICDKFEVDGTLTPDILTELSHTSISN